MLRSSSTILPASKEESVFGMIPRSSSSEDSDRLDKLRLSYAIKNTRSCYLQSSFSFPSPQILHETQGKAQLWELFNNKTISDLTNQTSLFHFFKRWSFLKPSVNLFIKIQRLPSTESFVISLSSCLAVAEREGAR